MKIMLDTNAIVWSHIKPSKLGKRTMQKLQEATTIYFSPLTFFEWLQKGSVSGRAATDLIESTIEIGLEELPLTYRAVLEAKRFGNLRGRDPMDMLILAQAANEGVDLYTSDMELLGMGLDFVKDSSL